MSLRTRLLTGMGLVVLLLAVLGVVVTQTTEDRMIRQVDQQLERAGALPGPDADDITNSTANPSASEQPRWRRRQGPATVLGQAPGTMYLAFLPRNADEVVGEQLPNTTSSEATAPDLSAEQIRAAEGEGPFTVQAKGGAFRYRVIVRSSNRPTSQLLTVYASPLEDVDKTVDELTVLLIAVSVAVTALLGLVTFWVLRLGVRPLKTMTETARAIGDGDLSRRIPPTTPGTEAGDLGLALNKMMSSIEGAFDERTRSESRLRRFVADASHELRTPVTTIRGYAELYRHGGLSDDAAVGEAMRRTEDEAVRMGALVEDLLHLARLDERRPLERTSVDLAAVVTDCAADAQAVEPDRPITVDLAGPVVVSGDERQLRQVVANLLANVRVHTDERAAVRIGLRSNETTATIEVSDEGPGMAPAHADRAFERFYRADASRTRHTGGSGLGLSIVASVLEAHGGRAEIESAPGRGTTVRLIIPIRADEASSGTPTAAPEAF